MTVALDVTSGSTRTGVEDPYTFSHAGRAEASGGVQGVAIAITHGTSTTDHVVGVSYGGVALTRVNRAIDATTELGAAEWWFVGAGLTGLGGSQTVSIDLASATTDDLHIIVITMTAAADIEVIDSDLLQDNQANPVVTMQAGGRTKFSVCACFTGTAAPGGGVQTGNTLGPAADLGAHSSMSCYETTVDAADHSIGWITLATDDLAFVAMALSEIVGAATPNLIGRRRNDPARFFFPDWRRW